MMMKMMTKKKIKIQIKRKKMEKIMKKRLKLLMIEYLSAWASHKMVLIKSKFG
jgi:hypothetical protein